MAVLVTCKNEEDPIRNDGARAFTTSFPLLVSEDFFKRSRAVNSPCLNLAEFQNHPRSVLVT